MISGTLALTSNEAIARAVEAVIWSDGRGRRVEQVIRRPLPAATSSAIDALDLAFADGTTLHLIAKNVGRRGRLRQADQVKPQFLHDPRREILLYERLASLDLGTARYFGALVDTRLGRYVLLLERVTGAELHEVGNLDAWMDSARWLARFQSTVCPVPDPEGSHLLAYDARFFRKWPPRARVALEESTRTGRLRQLERVLSNFERTVEALTCQPPALVHGDFYSGNILVSGNTDHRRICPVDWEMAGLGPPVLDLAALTCGWAERDRLAMVRAYLASLESDAAWGPSLPTVLDLLDHGTIALAVQWLGWSPGWEPPSRHARDWLDVASTALDRLGR